MDSNPLSVHLDHDMPLGDFTLLPPELLEAVMSQMSPLHLVPMMLSCSILNALGHNERVWDCVYKRTMPETHKALHLAPNPDYWKFRNASSIKFIFEFASTKTNDLDEVYAVMNVMKKFSSSALVQRAAVYVLRRLAYYPQVCEKGYREKIEEYRSTLGREGAVASTISVLENFSEPDIVAGSLCAIGNLVIDPENATMLQERRGIESIVNVIRRHPDSFAVLDYGCFALCNIGDEFKYKEALWRANAAQMALEALHSRQLRPEEMTPPLDLLSVLCIVPECKKVLGREIVEVIDSLFDAAMTSAKLMAHLLTLAVLVCENFDENRDYAVDCSFIERVFQALDAFKAETLVFVKASLVLFTLFWRNEKPVMVAHRTRLIRAIISAMKENKSDISLQRTSAAMLSDFAHSDSNLKGLIVGLGGKDLVKLALTNASAEDEADPEWSALAAFITID